MGYIMRRHSLQNSVVTGRIEGRRTKGEQGLKYLDSLCASWKDNVSPNSMQLIRALENECSGIARSPMSSSMAQHPTTTILT